MQSCRITIVYSDSALGAGTGVHYGTIYDCLTRFKIALKSAPKRATIEVLAAEQSAQMNLLKDGIWVSVMQYNREGLK